MQLTPEVTRFRSTLKEALYVESASSPSATDGRNQRFIIGSRWLNTTTDEEYVCVDNTPTAAVWKSTTSASGGYSVQTAAVAPTINDDSADGYAIGKMWVDTVTDTVYIATDVTVGAAVWVDVTGGGGGGAAVDVTADADPILTGTNVQSQLTSIADILRHAVMYTFMAGSAGIFTTAPQHASVEGMTGEFTTSRQHDVIDGYNLQAL